MNLLDSMIMNKSAVDRGSSSLPITARYGSRTTPPARSVARVRYRHKAKEHISILRYPGFCLTFSAMLWCWYRMSADQQLKDGLEEIKEVKVEIKELKANIKNIQENPASLRTRSTTLSILVRNM